MRQGLLRPPTSRGKSKSRFRSCFRARIPEPLAGRSTSNWPPYPGTNPPPTRDCWRFTVVTCGGAPQPRPTRAERCRSAVP